MDITHTIAYVALPLFLAGCFNPVRPPDAAPVAGTVAIWLSAEQDTYISSHEQDRNFGRNDHLVVAGRLLDTKLPLARFRLPELPPGFELLDAYLELYHTGRNEDGQTDDVQIDITKPKDPWDAMSLTWSQSRAWSAVPPQPGGFAHLCVRSQAWSGSQNIANTLAEAYRQGRSEYEVYLKWDRPSPPQIEKGFASNNHGSRRWDDLGLAPRLLIRLQLPPGATLPDQTFRTFAPNQDLGRLPQPVLMSSVEPGDTWPVSWQVTVGHCP
jgi:hypothetical protein